MKRLISLCLVLSFVLLSLFLNGCEKLDKNYGVKDVESEISSDEKTKMIDVADTKIMSSDRVMSSYFDISLFDEENYSEIYLGKKFKIDAVLSDEELSVPTKIQKMKENGWDFAEGNTYDDGSLVFSYETIETVLTKNGYNITAVFYNSSRSSQKLEDCNIVKFIINNDFYSNPDAYHSFNINGITNMMAITDIVDILGTPSHFYKVSDTSYYLDYFITKKDRRNGITIFINPVEDNITSVEFSFYK